MADNTASDPVDTSDDVALEDMEESFDEAEIVEDQAKEDDTEDVSEDDEQSESEEKESEEDTEDDDKAEAEESTEEESNEEQSDEDKQKAHNNEMAQQRIQAKREREQAVAQQKDQQEAYVAESGDDPVQEAVRQLQVDAYNNKVEGNTNKLTNGYERAVKDFPILSDQTPEIQAEVNDALDSFQAKNVRIDQWGNPSEVSGDLYQYLKTKADSIERLTQIGARKQGSDKTREKSKVMTVPSRTPQEPKKDAELDAFDEEVNKYR